MLEPATVFILEYSLFESTGSLVTTGASSIILAVESNFTILGGALSITGTGAPNSFLTNSAVLLAGQRSRINVNNGTLTLANAASFASLGGSVMTVSGGNIIMKDASQVLISESDIVLLGGDLRFENASTFFALNGSRVRLSGGDIRLSNNSKVDVRNSTVSVVGSVRLEHGGLFLLNSSTLEITGGNISLDATSSLISYGADSKILGTGVITGGVRVESGKITYSAFQNGTIIPTNLTITTLSTSVLSSFNLVLSPGGSPSTFVSAQSVMLNGQLNVIIDALLDSQLAIGSVADDFPFIQSASAINGSFANITLTMSSGSQERAACYRISQTSTRSLSILFDPTALGGRCRQRAPGDAPALVDSRGTPSADLLQENGSVGIAVGVTIAILAVGIIVAIIVVLKVPKLRAKFFPSKHADLEMKKVKRGLEAGMKESVQPAPPKPAETQPEARPAAWSRAVRPSS